MDANKSELVLSNSMFASDDQFSEDDLLDANGGQAVTWLNDDENEKLDMSINIDATNMFFNRVESAEIIYQAKKKTCKMIGKYVMGDKLGEGKSDANAMATRIFVFSNAANDKMKLESVTFFRSL